MYTWLATAAFGLEGVVKDELLRLGLNAKAEVGGARFEGSVEDAFLANLYLSCADRVQLVLAEEKAESFEALFQVTNNIPWEDILPPDARFPITGHCARSRLMSVSDCQSIVKKAIVERLKKKYKKDWFPETGSVYAIQVSLHSDIARITLNASGDALNRRGYRTWNGEAPLRETLAAAMVLLSPWRMDTPLHDPCCGTGTLLIEAAFRMARRAPGLTRSFDMEKWSFANTEKLASLRREAERQVDFSLIRDISGSDKDAQALVLCNRHIRQAGLEGRIRVFEQDFRSLDLHKENVCFLTNPPYGERLNDRKTCEKIYRDLNSLVRRHPHSRLAVITAHHGFERCYGQKAKKKRRLYNGRLECEFMVF